MDRAAYASMSAIEGRHWWFVARRRIIETLIDRFGAVPPRGRVLEAGCGTGGNLALLSRYGELEAFEFDDRAREDANAKNIAPVSFGALPDDVNFADGGYDLVALLDVLEHLEDDKASLERLGRLLARDGRLVLTVPAVPSLWSHHDEVHHHFRRYTRKSLEECVAAAGLKIQRVGYFNSLLFPLAWLQRQYHRLTGRRSDLDAIPGKLTNGLLKLVFSSERHLVPHFPMPIGLSLFAVVTRN